MIDADKAGRLEERPDPAVPAGQIQCRACPVGPRRQDPVVVRNPPFGEAPQIVMIGAEFAILSFEIFHFFTGYRRQPSNRSRLPETLF